MLFSLSAKWLARSKFNYDVIWDIRCMKLVMEYRMECSEGRRWRLFLEIANGL